MKKHISPTPLRKGATLADTKAHEQEHLLLGRRSFLRNFGLAGTAGLLLNKLPVSALSASSLAQALSAVNNDRILVMIRLKGGNDGLNTIIPIHDFGTYQAARPNIFIPQANTWSLNGAVAANNSLSALQPLWNEGMMKVVNNVGYPNQNLSHFRSSDIWASSSDAEQFVTSGWLGRMLENDFPDFLVNPPQDPPAIQIGGTSNLVFNNSDNFNYAISTENPSQLYEIARTGQLYDVLDVPECTFGEQLSYLRAVANTTFRYAGVLAAAFDAGQNSVEYSNDRLGDQLALIARLIRGGLNTRLYMVELDGFDTHANQPDWHAYLLQSLATNTAAFFQDLSAGGHAERTLAMTFSEFGRRIEQNGSTGTDHGAAAPLMVFGQGLDGNGVLGGLPNLQQVDAADNMIHQVDFRSVYATILHYWLCLDSDYVDSLLGGSFDRLEALGLFCEGSTSTTDIGRADTIQLSAYLSNGQLAIDYHLPATGTVNLRLHDALGRSLSTVFQGRQYLGKQELRLPLSSVNWSAGVYVVSLETGGRVYSRKVALF